MVNRLLLYASFLLLRPNICFKLFCIQYFVDLPWSTVIDDRRNRTHLFVESALVDEYDDAL